MFFNTQPSSQVFVHTTKTGEVCQNEKACQSSPDTAPPMCTTVDKNTFPLKIKTILSGAQLYALKGCNIESSDPMDETMFYYYTMYKKQQQQKQLRLHTH